MYIDCSLRFTRTIIDVMLEWIAISAEIVIVILFLFILWKKFLLIIEVFSLLIRGRRVEIEEMIVVYGFARGVWMIGFLEIIVIIVVIAFWRVRLLRFERLFRKLLNFVMNIVSLIDGNALIKQLCEDFDWREIYQLILDNLI